MAHPRTVLHPQLNIYPGYMSRKIRKFRTDTIRYVKHLSLWCGKNGIKINASKTQLIVIGTGQNLRTMPHIQLEFMGTTILSSRSVKNVGVVFDQNITFLAHVDDVVRRCTGMLIGLSHCRHALPQDTLSTVVQALVVSSIRYCISVYGVCGSTQMARLQKLLNFGARVISGRRKFDHISDVLKLLKWLTAENLHRYHSLTLLKRILSTGQPETLHNSLVTRGDIHHRLTRQADRLDRPVIRTESGRATLPVFNCHCVQCPTTESPRTGTQALPTEPP